MKCQVIVIAATIVSGLFMGSVAHAASPTGGVNPEFPTYCMQYDGGQNGGSANCTLSGGSSSPDGGIGNRVVAGGGCPNIPNANYKGVNTINGVTLCNYQEVMKGYTPFQLGGNYAWAGNGNNFQGIFDIAEVDARNKCAALGTNTMISQFAETGQNVGFAPGWINIGWSDVCIFNVVRH